MKLWLISQSVNADYDTYDSAVVAAETEEDARCSSPSDNYRWHDGAWYYQYADGTEKSEGTTRQDWCDPKDVTVDYIGEAKQDTKPGVICGSFHAG